MRVAEKVIKVKKIVTQTGDSGWVKLPKCQYGEYKHLRRKPAKLEGLRQKLLGVISNKNRPTFPRFWGKNRLAGADFRELQGHLL
jgi:hypothetical protein